MTTEETMNMELGQMLQLPSGAVLKNRLVKSAMSDSLADGEGNVTPEQIRLYERWAEGGVALSIIGEVQIDPRFPEKPGNLVLDDRADKEMLRQLTMRATVNGAHIWPQLGHAGALADPAVSDPAGPSALNVEELQCDALSLADIVQLPEQYAKAARLAKSVGFTGVQIHAGHGFLLSQFLSPLFNHRDDQYGGSVMARSRIIVEIIEQVRAAVGAQFPIGIKLNSSDLLEGGLTQQDALEVIRLLDDTSLDLIEISGGTYFPGAKSSSDNQAGKAYYVEFARNAKKLTSIPLVATGGFKTTTEANAAVESDAVDMVGIARALVINPTLANDWLTERNLEPDLLKTEFPRFTAPPAGGITAWYTMRINAIAQDNDQNFELDLANAIDLYEQRDQLRSIKWKRKFR